MRVRPDNPVPIFQQIVDHLAAAIASGIYKPGELVPSVRQMALTALVNPNTVQRAYELLEREGILVSKRGNGMAVSDDAPSLTKARTVSGVLSTFSHGIEAGLAAKFSKSAIEDLYRKAWNGRASTSEQTK